MSPLLSRTARHKPAGRLLARARIAARLAHAADGAAPMSPDCAPNVTTASQDLTRRPAGRHEGRDRAGANRPPESFVNSFVFTLKGLPLARGKPSVERHRAKERIDLVRSVLDELWHDRHLN